MDDSTIYNFSVEFYKGADGKPHLYISTDSSSGCDYAYNTLKEAEDLIHNYVDEYLEYNLKEEVL